LADENRNAELLYEQIRFSTNVSKTMWKPSQKIILPKVRSSALLAKLTPEAAVLFPDNAIKRQKFFTMIQRKLWGYLKSN
jgi:hypothetical protein